MADSKVPPFQSYASRSPNSAPRTPGKLLYLVLFILLLVVIGVGAAQFFISRSNDLNNAAPTPIEFEESTPTPVVEDVPEEEPTPTTELERSDLSVVIHNGNGGRGVAGDASDIMEDLGYTVLSTGNADNYDYEETVIQVSSANADFLPLLEKDLGESYTIGETSTNYTGTGDALIIIGAE